MMPFNEFNERRDAARAAAEDHQRMLEKHLTFQIADIAPRLPSRKPLLPLVLVACIVVVLVGLAYVDPPVCAIALENLK